MTTNDSRNSSQPSRARRRGRIAAISAAAAIAAVGVGASHAEAATTWQLWQLDQDWMMDAATWDGNYNGLTEQIWFDLDNDNRWDTNARNTVGGEQILEVLTYDLNEDGRWELWFSDVNSDGYFDFKYHDFNGDGNGTCRRAWPGTAWALPPATPSTMP